VDIIGRDYYYYPREANHGSLVASFEKLKEMFGGKKVITLAECGSVPFPDDMQSDDAGWSYFMPWYGDYTMDGWAHDNTAADWKKILNSDYVITLDKMPGWNNYIVPAQATPKPRQNKSISIRCKKGCIELTLSGASAGAVELYDIKGTLIARLNKNALRAGNYLFNLGHIAKGMYLIKVGNATTPDATVSIIAK